MTDQATSILTSIAEPKGWRMVSHGYAPLEGLHRWRLEKDGRAAHVMVTDREIVTNKGERMTDLLVARLNVALITNKNA